MKRDVGFDPTGMGVRSMNTQPVVIEGPHGPRIAGTRITIYDVYYYYQFGDDPSQIADALGLSPRDVREVVDYIEAHKDEVRAVHEEIEARIARGHPPDVQAKIDAMNAKYAILWADRRREFVENGDEGNRRG
jgi:uncharacterized protein (DUF433 family)